MTEATEDPTSCQCCTFGNHTEPCTCDGNGCCHPERHTVGGLRSWIADAIRRGLTFEAADPDSVPIEIESGVLAVVQPLIQQKENERMDWALRAADAEALLRTLGADTCSTCGKWVEPYGMVRHFRVEHATAEGLAESAPLRTPATQVSRVPSRGGPGDAVPCLQGIVHDMFDLCGCDDEPPVSPGPFEGAEIGITSDGLFAWRCNGGQGCEGWVGIGLSSEEAAWSEFRGHVSREHAPAGEEQR